MKERYSDHNRPVSRAKIYKMKESEIMARRESIAVSAVTIESIGWKGRPSSFSSICKQHMLPIPCPSTKERSTKSSFPKFYRKSTKYTSELSCKNMILSNNNEPDAETNLLRFVVFNSHRAILIFLLGIRNKELLSLEFFLQRRQTRLN